MPWKIIDLLWDPCVFLDRAFQHLENDKIDVSIYELDHICYRVETLEEYSHICEQLLDYGVLLSEAMIQWRPISTYKLASPIAYKGREIYCVEIPSPWAHQKYLTWYEHVEFVIDEDLTDFMFRYNYIVFTTNWIDKKINPDVSVRYSDTMAVKFHNNTLEDVIKYEQ